MRDKSFYVIWKKSLCNLQGAHVLRADLSVGNMIVCLAMFSTVLMAWIVPCRHYCRKAHQSRLTSSNPFSRIAGSASSVRLTSFCIADKGFPQPDCLDIKCCPLRCQKISESGNWMANFVTGKLYYQFTNLKKPFGPKPPSLLPRNYSKTHSDSLRPVMKASPLPLNWFSVEQIHAHGF